jgi:predicted transposase/invertase (TIGR01784 family)
MLEPYVGKLTRTVLRGERGSDVPDLPDKEMWEELAMNTPGLKKAMTTLEFLSQSKEVRALALAREKAELDQKSALRWARTEGEEKGRVKGEYEKAIQVAKNLLIEGDTDVSKIARITGLSKSGIEKLKEQKH